MGTIFGLEYALAQVIVEAAGVLASGTLASAGALIAYRSAYGNKPYAFIARKGISFPTEANNNTSFLNLSIHIFNTRKSAIKLSHLYIGMDMDSFVEHYPVDRNGDELWLYNNPRVLHRISDDNILLPGSDRIISISAPVNYVPGRLFKRKFKITINIINPSSRKKERILIADEVEFGRDELPILSTDRAQALDQKKVS